MRVGLVPLFGWMPHSAHFVYLAHAIKALGHEVDVLTCDGQLPTCYNIEIKRQNRKALRCAICRASTTLVATQGDHSSRLGQFRNPSANASAPREWIHSSLRTLHRIEGDALLPNLAEQPQAERLADAVDQTFARMRRWIAERQPDYVFLFNGRMDISRAILEALRERNVLFATVERSFAGHGINILPGEDCLGLKAVHRLTRATRDSPLPPTHAWTAGQFLHDRLMGQTKTEWRNYSADATKGNWPLNTAGPRFLILPSSMNEIQGSEDYTMDWASPSDGFEAIVARTGLSPSQVVVRAHPNWATNIGVAQGDKISQYYLDWAQSKGYHFIPAESKVRSADLMRAADLVAVSHSSAAFEAASVGRHVLAVGTAHYSEAGFAHDTSSLEKLDIIIHSLKLRRGLTLDAERQRRLLRYIHTASKRIPMFADAIVPLDARYCEMYAADNFDRLRDVLAGQPLSLDPDTEEGSEMVEDDVLAKLGTSNWPVTIDRAAEPLIRKPWPDYRGRLIMDISRRIWNHG
ncbi:capsular polysaccharide export protein, LipB/KpsS family [Roseivivax sp. CAU 1753]